MRRIHQVRAFFTNLFRRSRVDRDLSAELESYLELVSDQAKQHGADSDTARRTARLQLGGVAQVTESVRQQRAAAGFERLRQDTRYAVRGLRRAPGFAAMAILTLALGLGANTAIFSVVDAALFKPLPYKDPDRLVEISYVSGRGTLEQRNAIGLTWPQVDLWRNERQIFSAIEPFGYPQTMTVADLSLTTPTLIGRISPELLEMLGVNPLIGRWIGRDDISQSRDVVIIAEGFWKRAFGADRSVVGRSLRVGGTAYTIVGVLPATLSFRIGDRNMAGWLPFDEAAKRRSGDRGSPTVKQLRPGLTLAQAEREIDAAAARLQAETPVERRWEVDLLPFDSRGYGTNETRTPLLVLLGAVGCVLLIACANVANLLLFRVFERQREIAVRAALGATRARLMRQFLTEGLVIAALGGVAALALSWWMVRVVPASLPSRLWLFSYNPMALDGRTLLCCFSLVVVAGVLCGVVPAWRAARTHVRRGLESSGRVAGTTPGARRLRHALQIAQVALTLVLLTGTGLLASSFVRMLATEPGFDIDRLASVSISLPAGRYPTAAVHREFFEALMTRVHTMPGVENATYGFVPPTGGAGNFVPFGREQDQTIPTSALTLNGVDDNYFSVTGIPLLEGRIFNSADTAASERVAIIDEDTARRYWPGVTAIGQRFRYSPYVPWLTVVGVVGHVKTTNFNASAGTSHAFYPTSQNNSTANRTLLIRSQGDPLDALAPVMSIIRGLDTTITTYPPSRASAVYDTVLATPRFYLMLMSMLAGLALLTACVGLYGIVSYAVAHRTREIGVRIALGAGRGAIRRLVFREALTPVVLGMAAGLIGAWWMTRFLTTLLYRVTPHDPLTMAAVVAGLVAVALLAAWVPARRAMRVDPVLALRAE